MCDSVEYSVELLHDGMENLSVKSATPPASQSSSGGKTRRRRRRRRHSNLWYQEQRTTTGEDADGNHVTRCSNQMVNEFLLKACVYDPNGVRDLDEIAEHFMAWKTGKDGFHINQVKSVMAQFISRHLSWWRFQVDLRQSPQVAALDTPSTTASSAMSTTSSETAVSEATSQEDVVAVAADVGVEQKDVDADSIATTTTAEESTTTAPDDFDQASEAGTECSSTTTEQQQQAVLYAQQQQKVKNRRRRQRSVFKYHVRLLPLTDANKPDMPCVPEETELISELDTASVAPSSSMGDDRPGSVMDMTVSEDCASVGARSSIASSVSDMDCGSSTRSLLSQTAATPPAQLQHPQRPKMRVMPPPGHGHGRGMAMPPQMGVNGSASPMMISPTAQTQQPVFFYPQQHPQAQGTAQMFIPPQQRGCAPPMLQPGRPAMQNQQMGMPMMPFLPPGARLISVPGPMFHPGQQVPGSPMPTGPVMWLPMAPPAGAPTPTNVAQGQTTATHRGAGVPSNSAVAPGASPAGTSNTPTCPPQLAHQQQAQPLPRGIPSMDGVRAGPSSSATQASGCPPQVQAPGPQSTVGQGPGPNGAGPQIPMNAAMVRPSWQPMPAVQQRPPRMMPMPAGQGSNPSTVFYYVVQ